MNDSADRNIYVDNYAFKELDREQDENESAKDQLHKCKNILYFESLTRSGTNYNFNITE